jgi:hypothetical protein
MKKVIAIAALIVSFAILASSKVSATTLESSANEVKQLTKQELVNIISENHAENLSIDLAPIVLDILPEKRDVMMAESKDAKAQRTTMTTKPVNADE